MNRQGLIRTALLCLLALGYTACASVPQLQVHYVLPEAPKGLEGKSLGLEVRDLRKDKEILGQGAREDLEGFLGNLSLSVAEPGDPGFKVGLFEPVPLIREALKRRLEAMGARVVEAPGPGTPVVAVALKVFRLDLKQRRWKVHLAYDVGRRRTLQDIRDQAGRRGPG